MIQNSIRQILLIIRVALFDFFPITFTHCDYLLICHDNDRAYSYEGLAYSQLLDTLRENLLSYDFDVAVIATPISIFNGKKAAGNPISINGLYARSFIKAKIFALLFRSKKSLILESQIKLWTNVLIKMRPRFVIGIQPSAALCAAGKRLEIPTYDLQHGIIDHTEDPKNYYSSRSSSSLGKKGIPSSVICWNRVSANRIDHIWPGTSAIVAGNPWLLRFMKADPRDELVTHELNLLNKKLTKASGKKIILLTTQFVSTYDRIDIPSNIKDAISFSASDKLQWCIKFHPVELKLFSTETLILHAKNALGEENWVNIIDLSLHALPAILSKTSYHVTGFSATTFEASFLGVKTGLWDRRPDTQTWFREEIQNSTAELLPLEPLEIVNKITTEAFNHKPFFKSSLSL